MIMDEVAIMNTIHMYVMARITNLFDANELTEMYAQKLSRMAAYATAEDYLGKDAPEECKESFAKRIMKEKWHKKYLKENKKC